MVKGSEQIEELKIGMQKASKGINQGGGTSVGGIDPLPQV